MSRLLQSIFGTNRTHISESDILAFFDGEMSRAAELQAKQHLEICEECQRTCARLRVARRHIDLYVNRHAVLDESESLPRRERLLKDIDAAFGAASEASNRTSKNVHLLRLLLSIRQPAIRFALTSTGLTAALLLSQFWLHRSKPPLRPDGFLDRAMMSDRIADANAANRVILQKVRFRSSKQTMVRSIYHDPRGQRRQPSEKMEPLQKLLVERLTANGVPWDLPLSAVAYRQWHDQQVEPQDRVRSLGGHLLLLSTALSTGEVASESITVRDTDFHSVARTVGFRTDGQIEQVEIAELDFQVLPRSSSEPDLFEPGGGISANAAMGAAPPLTLYRSELPTQAQLAEAELDAKLILNQLHADTGEQIRIERTPHQVEVHGLVETDRRRLELLNQLHLVSNLKISLSSMEELDRSARTDTQATGAASIERTAISARPSPLDVYLATQGREAGASSHLSRQLLSDAVSISQESRSLNDLELTYAKADLTTLANAAYLELVFAHREKIWAALRSEEALLQQASRASSIEMEDRARTTQGDSLTEAAKTNLQLCQELTLGGNSQGRSALMILSDLNASAANLRADLNRQPTVLLQAAKR